MGHSQQRLKSDLRREKAEAKRKRKLARAAERPPPLPDTEVGRLAGVAAAKLRAPGCGVCCHDGDFAGNAE